MRRAAKTDGNHLAILSGLRNVPDHDISVFSSHALGRGFPDLIAAYQGRTVLFEVKDPTQAGAKLTPQQEMFFRNWRGEVYVVYTLHEALEYLRVL